MRPMETVTFHFDLGHLNHLPADQEFTLHAPGLAARLQAHDEDSRQLHAATNRALAALPEEKLAALTHFAEDVDLPTDAVSFNWVGYEATRPGAVVEEIGVVFQHAPADAVHRSVRKAVRGQTERSPSMLAHYGVDSDSRDPAFSDLYVADTAIVNNRKTAVALVMRHPQIATFNPEQHQDIVDIVHTQPSLVGLVDFLSTHPAESSDPWYDNTYVVDPSGKVMEPDPDLVDENGNPIPWPKKTIDGADVSVIPHYSLSQALTDAVLPVVLDVLKAINQDSQQSAPFKGTHWSTQAGVTQISRTDVPQPSVARMAATPLALQAPQAHWTIGDVTTHYGVYIYPETLAFDAEKGTLSVDVKNWYNRGLGVNVQYLDVSNKVLKKPDNFSGELDEWLPQGEFLNWLQPSEYKPFLTHLGAGSVFFGIPVIFATSRKTLCFVMPEDAAGARIIFSGLGESPRDTDVDKVGIVFTGIVSYGIPLCLSILSVGASATQWYMSFFDDPKNVQTVMALAAAVYPTFMWVKMNTYSTPADTLVTFAETVMGFLLSAGMKTFAMKLTGYVTMTQIAQNAPFVGWGLRIASLTAAVADMAATSIEVAITPDNFSIEAKRSMTLDVTVKPDPTRGTSTQLPIWPANSDHYEILVQYKGGTSLKKTGPMPSESDAVITTRFSTATADALPSAPGQTFTIAATIYSANNSICGKWTTSDLEAIPTDGDGRHEIGSIIQQLVPLDSATTYEKVSGLRYDGPTKRYVWEKSRFQTDKSLVSALVPGPVRGELRDAFLSHGVRLPDSATVSASPDGSSWTVSGSDAADSFDVRRAAPGAEAATDGFTITRSVPTGSNTRATSQEVEELLSITINDLACKVGYTYRARSQNLPLDDGTEKLSSSMYVFQGMSTLARPDDGMLAPTRGFSVPPHLAYDQFGPAGLLTLDPAKDFMAALDGGGVVPTAIRDAFASREVSLPAGLVIKVLTAEARWTMGIPGEQPLYDLRRQADVIAVFQAPAPAFSPNNFFLDTRTHTTGKKYHLRHVDLVDEKLQTFDYGAATSWGAFEMPTVDALAVHPNGYVVAASFDQDKIAILKLPAAGVPDVEAPSALPFSGTGTREGLMQGPVALTIAADGRILVLERTNARVQAFDTKGNLVQCFASQWSFEIPSGLAPDLDARVASIALVQQLQRNVPVRDSAPDAAEPRHLPVPLMNVPKTYVDTLNAGTMTDDLREQFHNHALDLGAQVKIYQTTVGVWLLEDPGTGLRLDLRLNGELQDEVNVYACFAPEIQVKAKGAQWHVVDRTNTLSFDVRHDAGDQDHLTVQNLSSFMRLKAPQTGVVTYLDLAVETKGFIYVLSHLGDGSHSSDCRLDIYNPDGTPISPTQSHSNGEVTGARISVDQWRTLFSLDSDQIQGAAGRPEPTISQWAAEGPAGS